MILTYINRNFDIIAMYLTNNKYMTIICNSFFFHIDCVLLILITCLTLDNWIKLQSKWKKLLKEKNFVMLWVIKKCSKVSEKNS